ncbi:MAG: LytTR family transcriptional regulator, partial [Chitinophagaceae bacterium]|nr:LytTR family transcriptional regulator [Chitinophagaceae bacterium]
ESKLAELEEKLPSLNFELCSTGFSRGDIFDRCFGIVVTIRNFHSYLLALLAAGTDPEIILLKEGFTQAQLYEYINELIGQSGDLGIMAEAFQSGVISREMEKNYLYLKNGDGGDRIRYSDIVIIRSDDNYVKVFNVAAIVRGTLPYTYLSTLDAIEETAAHSTLGRPNRTAIVNTVHISRITKKTVWVMGVEEDITPAFRDAFLKKAGLEE